MTTVAHPTPDFDSPEHQNKLAELYRDFDAVGMTPLWRTREGLMPAHPTPRAVPHLWRWNDLYPLAARSGELVPVGRGGERRAIGLGNPGLPGDPYATPTLWAAIQYLAPRENAPEHRHSQSAFRFVLEGEGVWTVVDGDPVAMRRGDLLLTPGWHFHGHQNVADHPMAWLDGLDIPLVSQLDQGFFEFGPEVVRDASTPPRSRNERLWGGPGLTPVSAVGARPQSPLMAYRWVHTDAALAAQLELEDDGHPGVVEPGHAAIRFTNPTTGGDALTTMRTEMHRLRAGTVTRRLRTSTSSVWQTFSGGGTVTLDGVDRELEHGDVVAVPSWTEFGLRAETDLDLFTFSDAPVLEKLDLARTEYTEGTLMRLATIRTASGTRAVRVDADRAVEIGVADVGELLADAEWRAWAEAADGPSHALDTLDHAPVVPRPGKIVCVGLNYAHHITEMGRELPQYPTLFAKYAEALVGAYDDIVLPAASDAVDWEAELAVVVGRTVRHADEATAEAAIAGYSVLNDVTTRDWQYRTAQWLQGKTFEATTPFGPELVTPDEAGSGLDLRCLVDGEQVQAANTADLVFGPAATIAYVSTILTLNPGDVLALGTPGGVGHARKPPRYLEPGQVLTTSIAGLGELRNTCVAEKR